MLHISDIEERLKKCPEPPEVRDMREMITDAFKDLEFFEEPHKYIRHKSNGEDIELPSVSSVLKQWEPVVDWDAVRMKKAAKEGIDPEVLRRSWEETNTIATSNGSKTHLFAENMMLFTQGRFDEMAEEITHLQLDKGYLVPYGNKEMAVTKFYEDLLKSDNIWPVMPEAKVYTGFNDKLHMKEDYCGTFDLLFAKRWPDGVIRPFMADWKTNKSLTDDYNRAYGKVMLPPFDYMTDENLSHYTLQMSLYSMALLQLGLEMTHRIIIWLRDDATYEKIPTKDVIPELRSVMEY